MHYNSHSLIAFITGAVSVNVPTPIDAMLSYDAITGLVIFCAKGVIGAGISIGINQAVDYYKKKKANK